MLTESSFYRLKDGGGEWEVVPLRRGLGKAGHVTLHNIATGQMRESIPLTDVEPLEEERAAELEALRRAAKGG